MQDIIIGIDPDSAKDGVAVLSPKTRQITAGQYEFGETINLIQRWNIRCLAEQKTLMVVIEAGWLNAGNFHLFPGDSKFVAVRKGVDQGRNHQRGLDIESYCTFNKVPYTLQKPLRKCWKGPNRKITQAEIESIMGKLGRLNQEGRDAALLAWAYANLPIICKV